MSSQRRILQSGIGILLKLQDRFIGSLWLRSFMNVIIRCSYLYSLAMFLWNIRGKQRKRNRLSLRTNMLHDYQFYLARSFINSSFSNLKLKSLLRVEGKLGLLMKGWSKGVVWLGLGTSYD